MRRINKLMAILLSLALCLSLLPISALADEGPDTDTTGEETIAKTLDEKTAEAVSDAVVDNLPEQNAGEVAVTDIQKEVGGLNDTVTGAVGEVTVGKDEEGKVIATATKTEPIVEEASKDFSSAQEGLTVPDAAGNQSAEDEGKETIEDSVKTDEVTYKEVTSSIDEEGKLTVTETDATDKAEENTYVDDYVGQVATTEDEKGNEVIDVENSTGKGKEIVEAAQEATAAAKAAKDAITQLPNLENITSFTSQEEKDRTKNQAQTVVNTVNTKAQEAQAAADRATNAYNAAESAYNSALEAYWNATAKEDGQEWSKLTAEEKKAFEENLVKTDADTLTQLGGTVGKDLAAAEATARKDLADKGYVLDEEGKLKLDEKGNPVILDGSPLAQLKAAQDTLEAAQKLADKAKTDAETAQAYATSIQAVTTVIQNYQDGKELSREDLLGVLQSGAQKRLESLDQEQLQQIGAASDRLAAIEGADGKSGTLKQAEESRDQAQANVNKYASQVEAGRTALTEAQNTVTSLQEQLDAFKPESEWDDKDHKAYGQLKSDLSKAQYTVQAKKGALDKSQAALNNAKQALDNHQNQVTKLTQEMEKIRKDYGTKIDFHRLANDPYGLEMVMSEGVLKCLKDEIDSRADRVQEAANIAKAAADRYEAAKEAVKQAWEKVNKLSLTLPNMEAPRRDAERRLLKAQEQLVRAEGVMLDAKESAAAAVEDYKEALDTVKQIEAIVIPTGETTGGGSTNPTNPTDPDNPPDVSVPDAPTGGDDGDDDTTADDTTADDDTTEVADTPVPLAETVIEDQAVPLAAGPITRAQFIDYLWRHEGEPASEGVCTFTDVAEDHEYFVALCWADENGVAKAYFDVEGHEDGTFEPDELVTVAAAREFLGYFETVFSTNIVKAADLTTLTGDDGEAVLNCDEVLAEFFGEEYVSPVDESELNPEVETAA